MRYFIYLSYDGTEYHGWQIQPDAISVQGEIQRCLSTILRRETLPLLLLMKPSLQQIFPQTLKLTTLLSA